MTLAIVVSGIAALMRRVITAMDPISRLDMPLLAISSPARMK